MQTMPFEPDFEPDFDPAPPPPPPPAPEPAPEFVPDFELPPTEPAPKAALTRIEPASPEQRSELLAHDKDDLVPAVLRLRVIDRASYERMCDYVKAIKALRGKVKDHYDPWVKRLYRLYKDKLAEFKANDEALEKADKHARAELEKFDRLEREKEEVLRRAHEAEQRRRADEAERERQKQLTQARTAVIEGRLADAANLTVQSMAPATPQTDPPFEEQERIRVSGVTLTSNWQAKVTNEQQLILAATFIPHCRGIRQKLADAGAPNAILEFLDELMRDAPKVREDIVTLNRSALNSMAKSDGELLSKLPNKWPGVEFYDARSVRVTV
jgi:hypothetical protein